MCELVLNVLTLTTCPCKIFCCLHWKCWGIFDSCIMGSLCSGAEMRDAWHSSPSYKLGNSRLCRFGCFSVIVPAGSRPILTELIKMDFPIFSFFPSFPRSGGGLFSLSQSQIVALFCSEAVHIQAFIHVKYRMRFNSFKQFCLHHLLWLIIHWLAKNIDLILSWRAFLS